MKGPWVKKGSSYLVTGSFTTWSQASLQPSASNYLIICVRGSCLLCCSDQAGARGCGPLSQGSCVTGGSAKMGPWATFQLWGAAIMIYTFGK